MFQINSISLQDSFDNAPFLNQLIINPDLEQLMQEFTDVFSEPHGLPPPRAHDHRILLLFGNGPVCVRPYRYPQILKNEIERLVNDLLGNGVIRPSNSPYSSPVLLVKKSDGSWRLCIDYRAIKKLQLRVSFQFR